MNAGDALKNAARLLEDAGIADPPREAASLLMLALGRDRAFLFAHPEYELTPAEETLFEDYLTRRRTREPLQYIRGTQEFYGLEFEISPAVLIPRPETEHLVETAIALLPGLGGAPVICDVGTGSGCIPVSILHEVKNASGIGLDISPEALRTAQKNAEKHGVSARLELRQSNVFTGLTDEKFDMIVSNPPYVPGEDLDRLQPEVRDFEPPPALTDGEDGLSIIRKIVSGSPRYLNAGGYLLMEIGFAQFEKVLEMFDASVWPAVELIPDLRSIPRVVKARLVKNAKGEEGA